MRDLFRNRLFVSVVVGHFGVDVLNSIGPVLLAVLAVPLARASRRSGGLCPLGCRQCGLRGAGGGATGPLG